MEKMKRTIAAVLALCTAVYLTASPAWMWELRAETRTYGDFEYEILSDGTIGITGYAGAESGSDKEPDKVTAVKIPEEINGAAVTSIRNEAFWGKRDITEISIPASVKRFGDADVSIGERCPKLTAIHVADENTEFSSENGVLFNKNKKVLLRYPAGKNGAYTIPESVTILDNACFDECTKLESLYIPDSVVRIEDGVFHGCSSLKKVYYSGSKEQWDKIQFGTSGTTGEGNGITTNASLWNAEIVYSSGGTDMDGQEEYYEYKETDGKIEITGYTGPAQPLTIPSQINGYDVTCIGEYAFSGCVGITEVIIPSSVTSIKPYAFYSSSLTEVEIPSSVTSIGRFAFRDCGSLAQIQVNEGNTEYASHEGVLYNKEKTLLICCPSGKSGVYEIAAGVKNIEDYAFYGCRNLAGIMVPEGVMNIQEAAFRGCSSLTEITLPSSLSSIGTYAFSDCGLESITLPSSVTGIGTSAFSGCSDLAQAVIPFSVTRIETGVFRGCSSLKNISIPSSVTDIGQESFYNCNNLVSITVPTSLVSVQKSAFAKCSSLRDVQYAGSEEQWKKIIVSMEGGSGENNQFFLSATIHFNNGTTINGPEKDADYKTGTISAFDQEGKTVRISGQIYAAAEGLDYSGLNQMVSSRETVIATFQNGKVTKIESLADVFRCRVSIRENSKPPITLQSSGYLEDSQDILVRLEAESDYPQSALQGIDDIGLFVSEMTVSVEGEGFCIRRMDAEKDETAVSIKELVNRRLSYETAEYEYTVYAKSGFTFTQEELPYDIHVTAGTEKGDVSSSVTLHALFQNTIQEINIEDARQELERLKEGDSLSLDKDFQHYLTAEQTDIIESYLYTWLAEVNYAYQYSGSSGIKERIMKKTGIDPQGDFASGKEQAVTHISADTKYGKKTFEITLELGKSDGSTNLYPVYGAMYYEVIPKDGIPSDVPVNGQIGRNSYADMGTFVESVKKTSEDSLHSTYQWQKLGDEKTAGILINKTIAEVVGNKNGSFSDGTFTVYEQPLFAYSKIVKVSCPVDVHVYSMDGREAGAIVNNEKIGGNENVRLDVNGDTKTVYLTGNDYYLNLKGTDTGTMKYEVEEIANEEVRRHVQFLELQLKKDMQYEGYVFRPLNIDRELYALRMAGSTEVVYPDKDSYEAVFKKVRELSLSQKSSSLESNRTVQLSASHLPLDASNPDLRWTTDNESVVKVDENGLVTAVGKGKATVTVSTKDGSFLKQFCVIDVTGTSSPGGSSSSGGSFGSGWSGGSYPSEGQTQKSPVIKVHYIIQFQLNGGTKISRKTMTLLSGDTPGIMPKAQRKDYTFSGWYTQQEGGEKVSGDKPLDAAATLYARWVRIEPLPKPSSLTLQSKKKGQLQAVFSKVTGAAGYEAEYSVNKNFAAAKTKEIKSSAKAGTITGLKANTKYYVRVRAYSLDSMGNRIYGAYSAAKSVKIKK